MATCSTDGRTREGSWSKTRFVSGSATNFRRSMTGPASQGILPRKPSKGEGRSDSSRSAAGLAHAATATLMARRPILPYEVGDSATKPLFFHAEEPDLLYTSNTAAKMQLDETRK